VTLDGKEQGFTGVGVRAGDMQPGFASLVYPLGPGTTLGVCYTLGGYFNYSRDTWQMLSDDQYNRSQFELMVRNQYLTVAVGRATQVGDSPFDYGVGIYYLNNGQRARTINATKTTDGATIAANDTLYTDVGQAWGAILGATYQPHGGDWRAAVTYRSRARLDGLTDVGQAFAIETPSRLSLGIAYEPPGPWIAAAELQMFARANGGILPENVPSDDPSVRHIDGRRAVTNLHLGVEYIMADPAWAPRRLPRQLTLPKGAQATGDLSALTAQDAPQADPAQALQAAAAKLLEGKVQDPRDLVLIARKLQAAAQTLVEDPNADATAKAQARKIRDVVDPIANPRKASEGADVRMRAGFRTNRNATRYTKSDDVYSLGLAYRRTRDKDYLYSLEPTAEILARSGIVQWTMTGILKF
jgi:hypothetical protein